FVPFRDGDRRGLPAVGFDDDGPPAPFGGHLEDHGVRDVLGGRISRISTFVTFTPQRVVTSSSFVRRIALISSRFDSTSSRMMSPTTARSVVVAIPMAAPSKLFTRITESAALATLK